MNTGVNEAARAVTAAAGAGENVLILIQSINQSTFMITAAPAHEQRVGDSAVVPM
jgi:hypothetical protein